MNERIVLSEEQSLFIEKALEGNNILVNACIGSGKTTAIQHLCQRYPSNRSILYLTYNKLLKLDAKEKITNPNAFVTNYHGFAFSILNSMGVSAGVTDLIQVFLKTKPQLPHYDLLLIDEYQDINQELSEMLEVIKQSNPDMQIVAVGDMDQKIYDYTTLNVEKFIESFLGEHIVLSFSNCFRLNATFADMLGRIWRKNIIGVNDRCSIVSMKSAEVVSFLANRSPQDILCLGSRNGDMSIVLNELESKFPEKFNKNTVFASIVDKDQNKSIEPKSDSAIFTTYDSSKGLERKICVIFDFTEDYWSFRSNTPGQSYVILRNIFCVAASRGKETIVLVENGNAQLSEKTLSDPFSTSKNRTRFNISEMFNYRYKEYVEKCFSLLSIKEISPEKQTPIVVKNHDGLIDLSPCIGIFQEASFFKDYTITKSIEHYLYAHMEKEHLYTEEIKHSSIEKQILFLTALETHQDRYINQVSVPFISEQSKQLLHSRLSTVFAPNEEVQKLSIMDFSEYSKQSVLAIGLADVVKNGIVYELKFVSELTHEHFLQCACYVAALKLEKGILWNTRTNKKFEISIKDRNQFFEMVLSTIQNQETKQDTPIMAPEQPLKQGNSKPHKSSHSSKRTMISIVSNGFRTLEKQPYFAVIDTETNWNDDVMSIGLVIGSTADFSPIKKEYYIISPEANLGGMYSNALYYKKGPKIQECKRRDAIQSIKETLEQFGVSTLYAYNAKFDYRHLPELSGFIWIDIMRIAAYRQFNKKLNDDDDYFSTGKLKRDYGVEPMYWLLTKEYEYREKHNAVFDAIDELRIMSLLEVPVRTFFENACINPDRLQFAISYFEGNNNDTPQNNKKINQKVILTHTFSSEEYDGREIIDAKETAEILDVSVNQVYQLIRTGKIEAYKKKNKYQVLKQSVFEYQELRAHQMRVMLWTLVIFAGLALIWIAIMLSKL